MSARTGTGAATAALLCALLAATASAETLKPTIFRRDPPPNGCKPSDCSLREAVIAANKSPGPTKIVLGKHRYRLRRTETGVAEPKTGDLDVISPATIVGKGPKRTAIVANGFDRVIQLGTVGRMGRPDYAINNVDVRSGDAHKEDGGGILVGFSDTTLKRVRIRGNRAQRGGGLASTGALITIRRSSIDHNVADGFGGGVFLPQTNNTQEASIAASTVAFNQASIGGGISIEGMPPPAPSDHAELAMVNSTVAENTTFVSGGGIHANNESVVSVDNSTIAYNVADSDGVGGGAGGGVRQATNAAFAITDSILAGNEVVTANGTQCDGTFAPTEGNLLVGQAGICSINATVAPDALLGPLANNGGPTKTIALLTGSPAIGLAVACPPRDQRGVQRTAGCDAGAFERPGP